MAKLKLVAAKIEAEQAEIAAIAEKNEILAEEALAGALATADELARISLKLAFLKAQIDGALDVFHGANASESDMGVDEARALEDLLDETYDAFAELGEVVDEEVSDEELLEALDEENQECTCGGLCDQIPDFIKDEELSFAEKLGIVLSLAAAQGKLAA